MTDTPEPEFSLNPSPDGKKLAYTRGLGDLIIRDLESGEEFTLLEGWAEPEVSWSPDGRWIAYSRPDEEYNHDVWIVPADGSAAPVNISMDPADDGGADWSPDGTMLAFHSYRGSDWDIYGVLTRPRPEVDRGRRTTWTTSPTRMIRPWSRPSEPASEQAEAEEAGDDDTWSSRSTSRYPPTPQADRQWPRDPSPLLARQRDHRYPTLGGGRVCGG